MTRCGAYDDIATALLLRAQRDRVFPFPSDMAFAAYPPMGYPTR